MTDPNKTALTVYFAGELFSDKHLVGNAAMAEAIGRLSKGRYQCVLPQCLEQREVSPEYIRNQDIREVIGCDLALFNFEGLELDSGTVVEFMFAKFLDIPSVVVRTDFRLAGDGGEFRWNLMAGFYPRTEWLYRDSLSDFKSELNPAAVTQNDGRDILRAALASIDELANDVIVAFDRVVKTTPRMPPKDREAVYNWIRLMPSDSFAELVSKNEISSVLERKTGLKLL